jgi:ectoine hydroxylase-related dioxygenase (phytanoyl-CoA dioxygenase family)
VDVAVAEQWLDEMLAALDEQGFAIIPDFLSPARLLEVDRRLEQLRGRHRGRNNFEGESTERIYTLVARGRVFQDIAEDERILALLDRLFMPNYLLTANQAICISPGETPQPWHTDDSFYPIPRPRPMISLSTIVAVDAFTADNGGTQVIPGSHRWDDATVAGMYATGEREQDPGFADRVADRALTVEMPAGACLVFAGTLVHRGGANTGTGMRRAFSNQYCEPWARPQENFFLAIPPAQVAAMSPRLQSLLGYSIHPPFMGQVSASHPRKALAPDFVPPAYREP